jgi:hypothetical protein
VTLLGTSSELWYVIRRRFAVVEFSEMRTRFAETVSAGKLAGMFPGVHEEKFSEKGSVTAEAVSVPTPMQNRSEDRRTASRAAQRRRGMRTEGAWVFTGEREVNEGAR